MLVFNPDGHTYILNGERLPSVTQVLEATGQIIVSPYAYPETGTAVHEACHNINGGEDVGGVPQNAVPKIKAYLRFLSDTGFAPFFSELQVYHPKLGYAGTLDLYGLLNNVHALIDIKTGKPEEWHKMQLVAYRYALRDGQGIAPKHCFSLYLMANGKYKLAEVPPMEIMSLWGQFQRLVKQYKEKS